MAAPASIVIVGAGQGGAMAANALRALGYTGPLTLIGREPHAPYERPPLSKAVLRDADAEHAAAIHPHTFYAEQDIRLMRGIEALALDRARREIRLADGTVLAYDRCLLATGGQARELPALPRGTPKVHYVRTLDDARGLRACLRAGARVVVVGGGFLGLEVASTALASGAEVAVIESAQRLLPNALPAPFSRWLAARAAASGARLRLGARIASVACEADGRTPAGLVLDSGETLPADAIVVAIGLQPEVTLARAAGLEIDPHNGGIRVDACCRSSDPDILAIGDCASQHRDFLGRHARLESWQNANEQARVAAAAMLDAEPPAPPYPWFWTDQFGCNIQMLGMPDGDLVYTCRGDAEPGAQAPRLIWLGHRDGLPVHGVAVNAAADLRQMRVLFERGTRIDPAGFADASAALKPWIKACQQAAAPA
ncbi:ferredoxin reductase [Bordetella sp. H567]|uniref:NAD(P)/FAD-dependent oxidoreductase n=1 Tax=Bordetella sp. H567 TaxID=1697043 RepID=UPI00081D27E0|nr:FAD-dependent oxidoreductase [Bordetella sp. H567]AOB31198.1 ferredoxin reductase [Bordetella sp. H567]